MIADLQTIDGSAIDADICIIGTGAAGILLALELQGTGWNIVMLEGVGLQGDARVDRLYDLETDGLPVAHDSRKRVYGGTTTVWTGGWKPLDDMDFVPRAWISRSGWPVKKSDLAPYYNRAGAYVGGMRMEDIESELLRQREDVSVAKLYEGGSVDPTLLWTLPEEHWNFAKTFGQALAAAPSVRVFFNAHVTKIHADASGTGVRNLAVQTLQGKQYTVTARVVIVACGGIENARLLLHSGIGNTHDQVGRHYMDHPKGNAGIILSRNFSALKPLFKDRKKDNGGILVSGLHLSPSAQQEHRTLNSYVQLRAVHRDRGFLHRVFARLFGLRREVTEVRLRTFMEQTPSPDNRVTLSEKRDAFDNPLAKVTWSISERDKEGVRILHETLREELSKSGLGELSVELGEPWPISTDASHHMGTTRMGDDPHTSVVDADCRVHGMQNLFIAGSSVFPTGGNANPTATIMALAVRLADHLRYVSS